MSIIIKSGNTGDLATVKSGNTAPQASDPAFVVAISPNSPTQPVSGTVTANQGTPNSAANSWPVEMTDGTNVLGTPSHPVRTDPTGTTTQPISAAALPLPSGASTSSLQTTGNTSLSSIDTKTPALVSGRVPVDGSGVTQPVSAASLPLPTGASTSSNQTNGNQQTQIVQGGNSAAVKAASTAAQASDPSFVVGLSPNSPVPSGTNTIGAVSIADAVSGTKASVTPTGLNVSVPATMVFSDPLNGTVIDTTNRWNAPVLAGSGTVTQNGTSGLIFTVSTTANNAAQISSQPTFDTSALTGQYTFAIGVQLEATPIATGNHRFWGFATQGTSYSTTNPIKDGVGFEVTTGGVLRAVIYGSDVLTFSQNLTIPTDGLQHAYIVLILGQAIIWYVDNFSIPVAVSGLLTPNNTLLPVRIHSLNGGSTTSTTPTLNTFAIALLDQTRNATQLADGVSPWKRMSISAKGVQGTNAASVQDYKDSGRVYKTFYIDAIAGVTSEALVTMNINSAGTVTTGTSYTVTSGKTLRLTSFTATSKSSTTTAVNGRVRVRSAASVSASSGIVINADIPSTPGTAAAGTGQSVTIDIPDGIEIAGGQQIGISQVLSSTSSTVSCMLIGFEY